MQYASILGTFIHFALHNCFPTDTFIRCVYRIVDATMNYYIGDGLRRNGTHNETSDYDLMAEQNERIV